MDEWISKQSNNNVKATMCRSFAESDVCTLSMVLKLSVVLSGVFLT